MPAVWVVGNLHAVGYTLSPAAPLPRGGDEELAQDCLPWELVCTWEMALSAPHGPPASPPLFVEDHRWSRLSCVALWERAGVACTSHSLSAVAHRPTVSHSLN